MIRQAVAKELRRRKVSVYKFSKSLKGVHAMTIKKWLYSDYRVSVETVERAMSALDLVVVPNPKQSKVAKHPEARDD